MSASKSSQAAIAQRYATAIFALASAAKKEEQVVEEIAVMADAVLSSAELRSALSSPLINKKIKSDMLAALARKAGKLTLQALATVADQGRADLLPKIAEALLVKLADAKGQIIAEVESARPLPESVQKQLADSLSKATGKIVHLNLKENPELLGGVAVQIGSMRLDASLSAALNTMRRELLASNA